MPEFIEQIHRFAGGYFTHPLVDGTELTGAYNFILGAATPPKDAAAPTAAAAGEASDPGGITVFEAIDRQLGLKVETQKKSMPVVVIDHVNQVPTEN
jgi:uncharacterized protein (TIGR03435 family)